MLSCSGTAVAHASSAFMGTGPSRIRGAACRRPNSVALWGAPPPLPRHTVARADVDDDGDSAHALVRALPRKPTAPPPPSLSRPAATGSPAVCAARTRRWRRGRSGCLSAPYLGAWVLGAWDDPVRTTLHGRVSLSTI